MPRKSSLEGGLGSTLKKTRARRPKAEPKMSYEDDIRIPPIDPNEEDMDGPGFNPTPHFYRTIAVSFLALAVVLAISVFFFTGGRAKIDLILKARTIKVDQLVTVFSEVNTANQIAGWVGEATVKGERVFNVSSGKEALAVAIGKVTLYNKSSANQSLVATTRLQTKEGVLCRLTHSVLVPAGGQVAAEMYADKPGPEFELPPSGFIIPGLPEAKQKLVYAESQIKMTGGTKKISALTEDDIKSANEELTASLSLQGQEELKKQVGATSTFTGKLFTVNIVNVKADKKVGEETMDFKVSGEVKVSGVFYDPAEVNRILIKGLQAALGEDEALVGDPLAPVVQISKVTPASGVAELRLTQEAFALVDYAVDLLDKSKILGKKVDEARSYLSALPWVEKIDISVTPSWVKKIPKEMDKVEIKIKER